MKFVLFALVLFSNLIHAQQWKLEDLAEKQEKLNRETLIELGVWSGLNLGYGFITIAQAPMGEAKYFHQMNAGWNLVNASIVALGWVALREQQGPRDFQGLVKNQFRSEQVFLVNTVLDLSYITGGLLLRQYGNQWSGERRFRALGFGSSVVLQGSYLLIHDLVAYVRFKRLGRKVDTLWNKVSLTANQGIGIRFSI